MVMRFTKTAMFLGVVLLFFAVLIGAFGAHVLQGTLEKNNRVEVFNTASSYHFYHAFALIVLGFVNHLYEKLVLRRTMLFCFFIGLIIFSGSLYLLAILNTSWLGAITPIGGSLLLIGWVMLAYNVCVHSLINNQE